LGTVLLEEGSIQSKKTGKHQENTSQWRLGGNLPKGDVLRKLVRQINMGSRRNVQKKRKRRPGPERKGGGGPKKKTQANSFSHEGEKKNNGN